MFDLNRRIHPKFSPIAAPVTHPDDLTLPAQTSVHPHSFGKDFNLIRAVEEYGPRRVESIRQELAQIDARQSALTEEMQTLEQLIAVTKVTGHHPV